MRLGSLAPMRPQPYTPSPVSLTAASASSSIVFGKAAMPAFWNRSVL
jgi:hypothetical protein